MLVRLKIPSYDEEEGGDISTDYCLPCTWDCPTESLLSSALYMQAQKKTIDIEVYMRPLLECEDPREVMDDFDAPLVPQGRCF